MSPEPPEPTTTAALRDLVDGKTIRIEFTERTKRDRWGRLLATCWVRGADGSDLDVGAELLRLGVVGRYEPK